jgi:FkbM family methyltransferase
MAILRGLSFYERLKLVRYALMSRTGLSKKAHVRIDRSESLVKISVGNDVIWTTSLHRWKRYKHGIQDKQNKLLNRYGYYDLNPKIGKCIDVGANIGEISIALSSLGHTVYAIEPEPLTLFCLIQNTKSKENIIVMDRLLWSHEDVFSFYIDQRDADSSIIANGKEVPSLKRKTTTLDMLWEECGLDEISFLKADCEGGEPELLEGGRKALNQIDSIAIDTGAERMGRKTSEECAKILKDSGFTVREGFKRE